MNADQLNTDAIDDAVLGLLYLALHDDDRAWKGFDWEALNRLHERGFIANPVNKSKSVAFTEQGLREAERLFRKHFILPDAGTKE
ncbi:DUF6429 family protein [Cupriavidus sp. 2MCAB6]|uniref:DUF6429 family protein n=1 Tax=Cupriavidus sp. 2MCAB6 TaxID=3232981 RepID=UPI003F8FA3FF